MTSQSLLSVVVPIQERCDDFEQLNKRYLDVLCASGEEFEIIYVVDYRDEVIESVVSETLNIVAEAKAITLSRYFGDSTALKSGIRASAGGRILVVPAYHQIEPGDILSVLKALDECDMAVAERDRENESLLNRIQSGVYNRLLRTSAPGLVKDMGCQLMALTREVADQVHFYGDQHRYLPILAHRIGFDVRGVVVRQSSYNTSTRIHSPGAYLRAVLEVVNLVFLTRFTKRPLRFFGIVGLGFIALGVLTLTVVIGERLFLDVELASRPALVLGALLLVVGLQITGIGLIGEIVVFSRAKEIPEYYIKEVVESKVAGVKRGRQSGAVYELTDHEVSPRG